MEKQSSRMSIVAAVCIGAAAAFLFCGYEFIRSTANTLLTEEPLGYGTTGLPYVMATVPVAILFMVYGYSWLLTRLGPRKTLLVTSLLSGGAIAACYFAISSGNRPARIVLYLVRESYVVLLVAQYWSFLNSRLGTAHAKLLYGPICGVGSLGAIAGAQVVQTYSGTLGVETMLLFGAAAIIPALLCSNLAYAYCGEPAADTDAIEPAPAKDYLALRLFRSNKLLFLLLLVVVLTQLVSTVLDLSYQNSLKLAYPERASRNAEQAGFWKNVGIAAAIGQFAVSPLLLRFASFTAIHIAMPLLNLSACAYALLRPSVQSIGMAYLIFKSLDYAIFGAAKEILYIPFSYDVRYRAKEVIDVWGYRLGKGGTGASIAILQSAGIVISAAAFASIACGGAALWLIAILPICSRYAAAQAQVAGTVANPIEAIADSTLL
jgi:AAA family ATP:ADP antiporter